MWRVSGGWLGGMGNVLGWNGWWLLLDGRLWLWYVLWWVARDQDIITLHSTLQRLAHPTDLL